MTTETYVIYALRVRNHLIIAGGLTCAGCLTGLIEYTRLARTNQRDGARAGAMPACQPSLYAKTDEVIRQTPTAKVSQTRSRPYQ